MNSHRDNLWLLLDEWIHDVEVKCQYYDVQLSFIKEKFSDDILLTIHYTRNSKCQFLIKNIDDLEDVISYLELACGHRYL